MNTNLTWAFRAILDIQKYSSSYLTYIVFVFMDMSLCSRERWNRGDLMLCLIHLEIVFRLPFQIFFYTG